MSHYIQAQIIFPFYFIR